MSVEKNLAELGLALPPPPRPIASYVAAVRSQHLVFVAGQVPMREGQLVAQGALGVEVTVEQGQEAARVALLNALAAVKEVSGSLENVVRILRAVVYVCAGPEFTQHAQVANGASDLLVQIFGEVGRHARSAVGVSSLPLGSSVEVELTLEVR